MAKTAQKRLLVTGASGFLGYRVCMEAKADWQVFGIGHRHPVMAAGVESLMVDLTDADALTQAMDQIRPHAVIHTAAVSQPGYCQAHQSAAWAVNVGATSTLAGLCARRDIPLVFTSTDLVFNGLNAPYSETDPVCPVNIYGQQKVEAEEVVRQTCAKGVICRMPLMFGHAPGTSGGSLGWIVHALKNGHPVRLFTDEYRTVVDTASAARGLLLFTGKPAGTYHLGGLRRLSRYAMGLALVNRGPWDRSLLIPASVHDATGTAPRSPDVSLVSQKAYALGYHPADFDEAMDATVRSWDLAAENGPIRI